MKLTELKPNPNNPRLIKDDKFKKLVKSLQEFPEMMEKRPMVCVTDTDGKLFPLGGNMRLKALQELKYKEIKRNNKIKSSSIYCDITAKWQTGKT